MMNCLIKISKKGIVTSELFRFNEGGGFDFAKIYLVFRANLTENYIALIVDVKKGYYSLNRDKLKPEDKRSNILEILDFLLNRV